MLTRLIWLAVRIARTVALVIVPFGYAITAAHTDVWMGAGCGIAIGLASASGEARGVAHGPAS